MFPEMFIRLGRGIRLWEMFDTEYGLCSLCRVRLNIILSVNGKPFTGSKFRISWNLLFGPESFHVYTPNVG